MFYIHTMYLEPLHPHALPSNSSPIPHLAIPNLMVSFSFKNTWYTLSSFGAACKDTCMGSLISWCIGSFLGWNPQRKVTDPLLVAVSCQWFLRWVGLLKSLPQSVGIWVAWSCGSLSCVEFKAQYLLFIDKVSDFFLLISTFISFGK